VFWVISVYLYFNIRNTLPKSGTFLLGHLYIYIYIHVYIMKIYVFWGGYLYCGESYRKLKLKYRIKIIG